MQKLILASVLLILPFFSNTIFGCIFVTSSDANPEFNKAARKKDFGKASAIFSGEVVKLDDFKAEFKIDKIWKGDIMDFVVRLTGTKDNGNGTYTSSSCDYSFKLGEKYLIYAYGKSDELKTHSSSRSSLLENAIEEIEGLEEIASHKVMNKAP
jgi:hypothetical protein